MSTITDKWIPFIKTLRVEPYMFLFIFSYSLKMVTLQQLFQDKICHNNYGYPDEFCENINQKQYEDSDKKIKILQDSTSYQLYTHLIQSGPGLILSFFVGYWSDHHKPGRKMLLIFGMFGAAAETVIQILNVIYFESG